MAPAENNPTHSRPEPEGPRSPTAVAWLLGFGVTMVLTGLILLLTSTAGSCEIRTTSTSDSDAIETVRTCSETWWRNSASVLLIAGGLLAAPGYLYFLLGPGDIVNSKGLEKGMTHALRGANERIHQESVDELARTVDSLDTKSQRPVDPSSPPLDDGVGRKSSKGDLA